jgi:hypothetical protein
MRSMPLAFEQNAPASRFRPEKCVENRASASPKPAPIFVALDGHSAVETFEMARKTLFAARTVRRASRLT